jgi:hypothetical protein
MREHSASSHAGVKVTDVVSLLGRFIEITFMQRTFLALIPIKLRECEGIRGYVSIRGYVRVYEGMRGYTRVCEGM